MRVIGQPEGRVPPRTKKARGHRGRGRSRHGCYRRRWGEHSRGRGWREGVLLVRQHRLAFLDVLLDLGSLRGVHPRRLAQILAETANSLAAVVVLLVAAGLVEDVGGIFGVQEQVREDLDASGEITG